MFATRRNLQTCTHFLLVTVYFTLYNLVTSATQLWRPQTTDGDKALDSKKNALHAQKK